MADAQRIATLAALASLLSFAGCSATVRDHGVPNLVQVDANVWRSGNPPPADDAWEYLSSVGVEHVLKLDFDDEGDDALAARHGITVIYLPIEPSTADDFWSSVVDVFAEPDAARLAAIEDVLRQIKSQRGAGGAWLVHCKNGHDRTGLVVGMLRVIVDGWDKRHAWREMLDRGYHPELLGLDHVFHELRADKASDGGAP